MYQPLRNFGRLSKEARGDCSLKEFTDTALKLRHNVLSKVGNPLVMALHECEILIFVGLEVFEFGILPACLVVLEVLGDVIIEEGLEEVQLEVILIVELFALLSLEEVVGAVLIAVLHDVLLEFALAHGLQLQDNAVFNLELCALEGFQGLAEIFHIDSPRLGRGGEIVKRVLSLLSECFTFSHFSIIFY